MIWDLASNYKKAQPPNPRRNIDNKRSNIAKRYLPSPEDFIISPTLKIPQNSTNLPQKLSFLRGRRMIKKLLKRLPAILRAIEAKVKQLQTALTK